jgi:hypothetical protein
MVRGGYWFIPVLVMMESTFSCARSEPLQFAGPEFFKDQLRL